MNKELQKVLDEGDRLSRLTLDEVEAEALAGNGLAVLLLRRADEAQQREILYGDGSKDGDMPGLTRLFLSRNCFAKPLHRPGVT